jgi:CrcB protein
MMFLFNLLSVALGAAAGASLRWGASSCFNTLLPKFPLGTLLCNLAGGLGIGIALALFLSHDWPPQVRLFIITGFLGGLTTFSTFSSEVTMLLLEKNYALGFTLAATHLLGSLAMTAAGFVITKRIFC